MDLKPPSPLAPPPSEGSAPRPIRLSDTWGPPPGTPPGLPPLPPRPPVLPTPPSAPAFPPVPTLIGPMVPAAESGDLHDAIVQMLETIFDPEIPVNIWELGLVYELKVSPAGEVAIQMTLTSPACPVAESLPPEVEAKVRSVAGVKDVKLDLVWDPPWSMARLSEAARLQLGML